MSNTLLNLLKREAQKWRTAYDAEPSEEKRREMCKKLYTLTEADPRDFEEVFLGTEQHRLRRQDNG